MAAGSLVAATITALLLPVAAPVGGAVASADGAPSVECVVRTTPLPSGPATLVKDVVLAHTSGRVHVLTLNAPALYGDVNVDVLLPAGYDPRRSRRYHVLYLLHGAGGSNVDWVDHGVQRLISLHRRAAHLPPFITVMPDDGLEGFYANWYGRDLDQPREGPPPGWATFTGHELIDFIDARYRTLPGRRGRAIAGLSMGGFGATSLTARYPDAYSVTGSFSGAVDTDYDYPYENLLLTVTNPLFTDHLPDACVFGDPLTERVRWEADDPTYLAENLAFTHLFIASGNGEPGPYDSTSGTGIVTTAGGSGLEADILSMNQGFIGALNAAHVRHTDYLYGPGTHSWGYWERDLRHFLPFLARGWRHPRPAPRQFSYRSAARHFQAWGWSFTVVRAAPQFVYLDQVGKRRIEVTGNGRLRISTARDYRPGSEWTVRTNGRAQTLTASRQGRLHLAVTLGSAPTEQQVSFPQAGAPPSWRSNTVTIHPAGQRDSE